MTSLHSQHSRIAGSKLWSLSEKLLLDYFAIYNLLQFVLKFCSEIIPSRFLYYQRTIIMSHQTEMISDNYYRFRNV